MTKMYKIELYLIPLADDYGEDEHKLIIENAFEDGLVKFKPVKSVDIGDFNDDHKFNFSTTPIEEYRKEFEDEA